MLYTYNCSCCLHITTLIHFMLPATDVRREYLILCPFKSDDQYKSIRSDGIYLFIHLCDQELKHISCKVI